VKKKCRVFWDLEARAASIIRANQSSPWWWMQYAPLKRRSTSTLLHGVKSQETLNFICKIQIILIHNKIFFPCFIPTRKFIHGCYITLCVDFLFPHVTVYTSSDPCIEFYKQWLCFELSYSGSS
jgi:hypothetical protein